MGARARRIGCVPRLSVIVPASDRPPELERCLAALQASDEPPEEVVVVEDPGLRSAAAARNAGARGATSEVIVFVDADVEVHPDALSRVRARLDADPSLVAVFGSYDEDPEAPGVVSRFRNLLHYHVHQCAAGPATTFWTGLGAIRRDDFVAAGGFRLTPFPLPLMEDVDFGMRLTAAGKRIEIDPEIQGKHLKRWTLPGMLWTDFGLRGVPWTVLLLQQRRGSSTLNLGWQHRATALLSLAAAVSLLRGRPLAATASLAGIVALNEHLYRLLVRKLGMSGAAASLGLHALHHLTGIAAAGVGLAAYLLHPEAESAPPGARTP